ncbi:MAG: YfiR family protein [Sedimentisphaerales bacterium]|nr:YfiR family protein [Sedimentisphaerales bacterium]
MRTRPYNVLFIGFTLALVTAPAIRADSEKDKEYQIKAAFLYNFIKFVDWPKEKDAETENPITIGIIGSGDLVKAFDVIKGKKIENRNISIQYFTDYEKLTRQNSTDDPQWDKTMDALKVCHVLMFCVCDSGRLQNSDQIVKALKELPILTVGEADGFLESGGIINFIKQDEKIRFEINNAVAKKAKLTIRSKLLRLAKKVIDEKTMDSDKN